MGTPQAISRRLHVVGPRTGEGLPVCALRCRMDGAGCTAASVQVPRRSQESSAFGRQSRSTGVIQRGQQQNGACFASFYAKAGTFWLEFSQLGVRSRREYGKPWPPISAIPTISAVTFAGVVNGKHRCRPASEAEIQLEEKIMSTTMHRTGDPHPNPMFNSLGSWRTSPDACRGSRECAPPPPHARHIAPAVARSETR